jgi:hypothetical protein
MFILEQRYGNDGYAFWFKMLELLGSTKGHYIDCNNEAEWEFLQAKTHQNNGFCAEILNLLAKLDGIDHRLWKDYKIIWCQNFVDGIADVYNNRKREIPPKPIPSKKPSRTKISTSKTTPKGQESSISTIETTPKDRISGQPTNKSTQSKGN